MTGKQAKIEEFLQMLRAMNQNKVDGDAHIVELFGPDSPFSIACNKCGSMNVEIIGEAGVMYSVHTGYVEGETVIKCINCGAAVSCYS